MPTRRTPKEPCFTLYASDPQAAKALRKWGASVMNAADPRPDQERTRSAFRVMQAFDTAKRMDRWTPKTCTK